MNITKLALTHPSFFVVGLVAILLAGFASVAALPIQLFPDIERPWIQVSTSWRGAAPQETESEIVEPLEEVLEGMPGLLILESWAFPNGSEVNLQFGLETDIDRALLEITTRLNRLRPLPADAERPTVSLGGTANDTLIYFFVQQLPSAEGSFEDSFGLIEDQLIPALEAVPGVADVEPQSGAPGPKQLRVNVDPARAAAEGITLTEIANALGGANDVSGGFVDVGRRRYTIRFEGRFDPKELEELVLDWRDDAPLRLGDLAEVRIERAESIGVVVQNGRPAVSLRVARESGSNVLDTLSAVFDEVEKIKKDVLLPNGLTIEKSFDPSVFINRAIRLLVTNLLLGMLLAVGVLWLFVRRFKVTLAIAVAIPISLLGTFLVLRLFGRTLNVISLAGLAFAVGMVLDAAIVVMENTLRLREEGASILDAAGSGAREVSGALIASTATTVAVFIPVLFTRDVEGQLFSDLALTIAVAVAISLLVALLILPLVATRVMRSKTSIEGDTSHRTARIADFVISLTAGRNRRIAWIVGLIGGSAVATFALAPAFDYLPPVRRDAVDVYFDWPASSTDAVIREEVTSKIVERLAPYMNGEKEPALLNYYFISWGQGGTIGARAKDQAMVNALRDVMRDEVLVDLVDARAPFVGQGELFGGFGNDGSVAVHLQSGDRASLGAAAERARELLEGIYPGANVRVMPPPVLQRPELSLTPDDRRMTESGWRRADMGRIVRILGDGLWLGEYFDGDETIDLVLRAKNWETPDEMMATPLATPNGAVLPLNQLVSMSRTVGPDGVRRVNGRRTVTLSFNPPEGSALQDTLRLLQKDVVAGIRDLMPEDGTVLFGGSASDLARALNSTAQNAVVALVVLFLLTAGLFKSVRDAGLVTITLPLAAAGGMIGLRLLNLVVFQPLDLLTLIGFIILLGLVVNNAILLVARTREAEAEGMTRSAAVRSAVQSRIRPILMSTCTSLLGMLPLVVAPGAGSAIYRGMSTAIVGGLAISTLFTLILLPSLLGLGKSEAERRANLPRAA
ncbi:MAG: efflux RND transporter permease subunit [Myxococcota bacterium]